MEVRLSGIRKVFRKRMVLRDVSLAASSGECIGILGANGSGKSTLLSVLAGTARADGGAFLLDGRNLFADRRLLARSVGYVPQSNPLVEELTAYDNLRLWYSRRELEASLSGGVLGSLGIPAFIRTPVSRMSGGMKKRLSIGCAVAGSPPVLLMDEPSAALDIVCREQVCGYCRRFVSAGGILFLATHDGAEMEVCTRWFVVQDGMLAPYQYDGDVHRLAAVLQR